MEQQFRDLGLAHGEAEFYAAESSDGMEPEISNESYMAFLSLCKEFKLTDRSSYFNAFSDAFYDGYYGARDTTFGADHQSGKCHN